MAQDAAGTAADLLDEPGRLAASGPDQDVGDLLRRAGRDAELDVTSGLDLRFGTTSGTGLSLCQAREAVEGGRRTRFAVRITHTGFGWITNGEPGVPAGRDRAAVRNRSVSSWGGGARTYRPPRAVLVADDVAGPARPR